MIDHEEEQTLVEGYKSVQIIFFAILGSLVTYGIVGFVLERSATSEAPSFRIEPLVYALTAVAAALTLAAWFLRKVLLNRDVPKNADDDSSPAKRAVQNYRSTIVIVAALAESIGIFGLVLLILGARQSVFFTFLGLSAVVMWILGPKFVELKALAERYSKTS